VKSTEESTLEIPPRKVGILSIPFGWRDRNKGKPSTPKNSDVTNILPKDTEQSLNGISQDTNFNQ